jgi:hypothetical protein
MPTTNIGTFTFTFTFIQHGATAAETKAKAAETKAKSEEREAADSGESLCIF